MQLRTNCDEDYPHLHLRLSWWGFGPQVAAAVESARAAGAFSGSYDLSPACGTTEGNAVPSATCHSSCHLAFVEFMFTHRPHRPRLGFSCTFTASLGSFGLISHAVVRLFFCSSCTDLSPL